MPPPTRRRSLVPAAKATFAAFAHKSQKELAAVAPEQQLARSRRPWAGRVRAVATPTRVPRSPASTGSVKSPMTTTEKILARASERASLEPGENVWVDVDVLMTHDVCSPGTIGKQEFGENAKVWDREKVVIIPDQATTTSSPATSGRTGMSTSSGTSVRSRRLSTFTTSRT